LAQDLFPKIDFRTLAATFCFYTPIYRDLLLWGGAVVFVAFPFGVDRG
jgi:2-acylglycerol O-acyltransferase 2